MWKWIIGLLLLGGGGYIAYDTYRAYRAGLFSRPDMPNGAFSISYKNGFRAILVGVPNEKRSRRYFGYSFEVPFYLEDVWSFCAPPNEDESARLLDRNVPRGPGERLEAVCTIDVDGDIVLRGVITSVPRL